jgi:hypothetical protein
MFGIDVILIMVRHIFYRLLMCVNSTALPEQHTRQDSDAGAKATLLRLAAPRHFKAVAFTSRHREL